VIAVHEIHCVSAAPPMRERQRASGHGVWGRSPQEMKGAAYKRIPVEVSAS
jgi:hypothetical protein